ncbi:MAG TPA: hypothetical protein EYG21_00775 [Nitrospinaceae bacterium]|nr:hypothetical protein [Nitrospinaceae bacterium]
MKITRSQLKRIIQEELQEDSGFMDPGSPSGHTPIPPQKKSVTGTSMDSAITKIIRLKFKMLDTRDAKELREKITTAINDVVDSFQPTPLREVAPPGMEDKVKALKDQECGGKDDCPAAFRIAWAEKNKKKNK